MLTVTHFLNAFLMLAWPVALWLWLARRWRLGWRLVGLGALMFAGSQAIHIPVLYGLTALFANGFLPHVPAAWAPAFNILVLSLLAGLFEETARYIGYRWLAPQARTWREAVVYGAGHGGLEALAVGGATLIAFFQFVSLQTTDLSTLPIPADQQAALAVQLQAYWSMAWPLSLLGAVERALAITLHITLSVLVLQALTRRNWLWWAAAVLWHAFANAAALTVLQLVGAQTLTGALASEGALLVIVVIGLAVIFRLRPTAKAGAAPPPRPVTAPAQAAADPRPLPPVETAEKLDDSRYTS